MIGRAMPHLLALPLNLLGPVDASMTIAMSLVEVGAALYVIWVSEANNALWSDQFTTCLPLQALWLLY